MEDPTRSGGPEGIARAGATNIPTPLGRLRPDLGGRNNGRPVPAFLEQEEIPFVHLEMLGDLLGNHDAARRLEPSHKWHKTGKGRRAY